MTTTKMILTDNKSMVFQREIGSAGNYLFCAMRSDGFCPGNSSTPA